MDDKNRNRIVGKQIGRGQEQEQNSREAAVERTGVGTEWLGNRYREDRNRNRIVGKQLWRGQEQEQNSREAATERTGAGTEWW